MEGGREVNKKGRGVETVRREVTEGKRQLYLLREKGKGEIKAIKEEVPYHNCS